MEKMKQYLISRGASALIDRIHVFSESSATVELAAQRLNCEPAHIAKSLSYMLKTPGMSKAENKEKQRKNKNGNGAEAAAATPTTTVGGVPATPPSSPTEPAPLPNVVIIVAAGDARVNTKKYKEKFSCSPQMLKREDVETAVGFPAGGVCPFGVNENVRVFLDVSLKRFEKVYPACGTDNTGIGLSIDELEKYATNFVEWVDLCDGWRLVEEGSAAKAAA